MWCLLEEDSFRWTVFEQRHRIRWFRVRGRAKSINAGQWRHQRELWRSTKGIAVLWVPCSVSSELCRPISLLQCNQIKCVEASTCGLTIPVTNFIQFSVADGSILTLDEAWAAFNDPIYGRNGSKHMPMTTILTQMEHPILFRPFLTLHPCRIAELLQCLPNSANKVLTFLSTIGPAVHLKFDLKYAEILKWNRLAETSNLLGFHRVGISILYIERTHFLCTHRAMFSIGRHWRI